ncbi:hypothetical protein [Methanohalophilus portucalensis]|uniref:Uncharacterized protein n=3 Tax=Methanohalophilus portucalensis TaxID=39664 RepID=A0A1X7N9W5_9EURY|nr:hypothetical protein [Methanohalophilus portucalensis]ATU08381.1 hypothetical protein BKM01_06105 [Methanohalophilus portucalensis]SMH34363.1 hypothetical protein SAMN06264941_0838 [Methanohalophilus portucalensis FDF-1]
MKTNVRSGMGVMLVVMLLVSMLVMPTVSAKTTISQNEEYIDAIDMSGKVSIYEEEIKKMSENVTVLKETDTEKIVSFVQDDGSIGYAISWVDEKNTNKIYFTFVDQNELITTKQLSSSTISNSELVAASISAAKSSFWHGSYVEQYGNLITGGVHIYFSPTDASYVANTSSVASGGLVAALALLISPLASAILGPLVIIGVQTVYWMEQNSDGSLDVKVPFANIASMILTGSVYMKVGDSWYKF